MAKSFLDPKICLLLDIYLLRTSLPTPLQILLPVHCCRRYDLLGLNVIACTATAYFLCYQMPNHLYLHSEFVIC